MCNPRRIRVRATRSISEQWRAEIVRTAQASGTVTGEARLVQPLSSMLAPAAQRGFEQAVGADANWQWHAGQYVYTVPGGSATYQPDTGQLEIVARISADIQVDGSATRTATGEFTDEIEAEREHVYYTDGFAGRTRERVRAEGQERVDREAERLAEARRAQLAQRAREEADRAMRGDANDLEAAALADAERNLAEQSERARETLDSKAGETLEEVHRRTLGAVLRTVAAGYQSAMLEYARHNGAENISVTEEDGVIEIQFEMEA